MDEKAKKKPGRKPHTAIYTETIIIMVDNETRREVDDLVRTSGKSISEIGRAALSQYLAREKRRQAR